MFYIVPQGPIPGEEAMFCEMATTYRGAEQRAAQEISRTHVDHIVVEVHTHDCSKDHKILENTS
jgi:hypothetical protein